MKTSWAAMAATKAKAVVALTAAVVTGGIVGGVLSLSGASADSLSVVSSSQSADRQDKTHAGQKAKADPTSTEPQGVHGRCVWKVARDKSAVGGPHHNHGGAVSAAAHSCPHGHEDTAADQ